MQWTAVKGVVAVHEDFFMENVVDFLRRRRADVRHNGSNICHEFRLGLRPQEPGLRAPYNEN